MSKLCLTVAVLLALFGLFGLTIALAAAVLLALGLLVALARECLYLRARNPNR
jgi:hypothetical protein